MTDYRSKYDRLGYSITVMAIVIQGILWLLHLNDVDEYGQYFMYISFYELIFALIGFLLYDPVNRRGFSIKKKGYSKISGWLFMRMAIILGGMALIQVLVQFIPLTVTDPEIAMSIVFAGPCEENFFRGVLISILISLFANSRKYKIPLPFLREGKRSISSWETFGIFIVAIFFAGIHVNYYENPQFLLGTFLCGIWLGFTYWYWEDLTANIGGHMLLNLIVVWQTFYMVSF